MPIAYSGHEISTFQHGLYYASVTSIYTPDRVETFS